MELVTERLRLRPWQESDAEAFAAMNADPEVMADLGGPLSRRGSDRKLERFSGAYETVGYCRWVIEGREADLDGEFLGYTGAMPADADHPLGPHDDIGWRLRRAVWGRGFAVEGALAALRDMHGRVGRDRVLAYTAPDNHRSQAVMGRLGLQRSAALDFVWAHDDGTPWSGLVWTSTGV